LAGGVAAIATHPLDLLKVHLQTQQAQKMSLKQLTIKIWSSDGFFGFFNGLSASLLRQMTYQAPRFGVYQVLKRQIEKDNKPIHFYEKVLLGGFAGICGGITGSPADLIKVRMQNDMKLPKNMRRNYKHVLDGVYRICKEEGVSQLFNGCGMATFRGVVMTIGQLSFYDQTKQMLIASEYAKDNIYTHLCASFLAASMATALAQPMDVVKTRLMNAKPGEFKGVFDCVVLTAKLGPLGFWKGFVPSWVRLLPNTVIVFLSVEQLRIHFGFLQEPSKRKNDE